MPNNFQIDSKHQQVHRLIKLQHNFGPIDAQTEH